jgi:hypothetical protein
LIEVKKSDPYKNFLTAVKTSGEELGAGRTAPVAKLQ